MFSHFTVEETEVLKELSNLLMATQLVSGRGQSRTHGFLFPELESLAIVLSCLKELLIIGIGFKLIFSVPDTEHYLSLSFPSFSWKHDFPAGNETSQNPVQLE